MELEFVRICSLSLGNYDKKYWCLCAAGVLLGVGFTMDKDREGNATLEVRRGCLDHLHGRWSNSVDII